MTTLLQSSLSEETTHFNIRSLILLIYCPVFKKKVLNVYIMTTTEDIHVGHLLPFLVRCLGLFHFLVGFVKGEPHMHPSARE